MEVKNLCLIGLLVRLVLILYGEWQDENFAVKYTDVDYVVFTDAARQISLGNSPYDRATYRYTPLLAYAMLPNIWLFRSFGKLLFVFSDIGVGWLISKILARKQELSEKQICLLVGAWMFHPLAINISTRGNADTLVCWLILSTIYSILKKEWAYAAVTYGLAIHFRIYPILFAPSILLYLVSKYGWLRSGFIFLKSGLISGSILILLGVTFYHLYGYEFLYEAYLYHLTRTDNRHNFSVYFYDLYLKYGRKTGMWTGIVAFAPQLLAQLSISCSLHRDISFCFLIQTLAFVAFNKVCTAQYFLWYVSLFPVVLPTLYMNWRRGVCLFLLWIGGQLNWLYWAYKLEFLGENTFHNVWISSLFFFLINIFIISELIRHHKTDLGDNPDTNEKKKVS